MKAEPSSGSSQRQETWQIFLGTVVVTLLSTVTVLGAIVLSLQNQTPSGQPVVRRSESGGGVQGIPTAAIVTPPPITLIATLAGSDTGAPSIAASATPGVGAQETPTFPPVIYATPTPFVITVIPSIPTLWPCAGGVPMDWKLYIVRPGDTLFSLARRHGTTMERVIYINCLTSYQLRIGQRLYLPALPTPIPSATATFTPMPSPSPTLPSLTPPLSPSPTTNLTLTATPSPLPPATVTSTIGPTVFPTETPTMTLTPSATAPVPPTETATSVPTVEVSTTPTPTTYPTASTTATLMPTASATPTSIPTPSPSLPPTPTSTPIPSPTSSAVETPTATPVPVP